jgi:hypothetical protein
VAGVWGVAPSPSSAEATARSHTVHDGAAATTGVTREETEPAGGSDGRETRERDDGTGATARVLVGLTVVAGLVALLGVGAVWAFAYGPLG